MIDPTRSELLKLIEELSEACPEYRFGQLVLNLAFLRVTMGIVSRGNFQTPSSSRPLAST